MNIVKNFINDESGATAIEYGLIAALIAVAIIGALSALGTELNSTFSHVEAEMKTSRTATSSSSN